MIEVVSLGRRTVRLRPSLARGASSIAVIASGGSEGREGPIIQIGAAFASALARVWKLSPERIRILTACGMAAGVAGAYNTPIAATLFVLEVVVGSFAMTLFGPAVVAAVVSTLFVRFVLGDEPVYQVAPFRVESLRGVRALHGDRSARRGAPRPASSGCSRSARRLFAASKLPVWAAMAIGGAIVGAIAVGLPEVFGNGFEATDRILHGNPALALSPRPLRREDGRHRGDDRLRRRGRRVHAVPAGRRDSRRRRREGRACGAAAASPRRSAATPCSGMGGMLAGVTRAPLLAVIMIFELTQNTAVLRADDGGLGPGRGRGQGAPEGLHVRREPPIRGHRLGEARPRRPRSRA